MNNLWRNCPVTGWAKLERKCEKCGQPKAEIEFVFSCSGLPQGYVQGGQFALAWHWHCLPTALKHQYDADTELLTS